MTIEHVCNKIMQLMELFLTISHSNIFRLDLYIVELGYIKLDLPVSMDNDITDSCDWARQSQNSVPQIRLKSPSYSLHISLASVTGPCKST